MERLKATEDLNLEVCCYANNQGIRPFRAPDAKEIITWTSKPEEFYKWSAGILGNFPVSEERLLEAVSGRENNTKYFPLTAFDKNGLVGFFTVRTPGDDDKKVRFGFIESGFRYFAMVNQNNVKLSHRKYIS